MSRPVTFVGGPWHGQTHQVDVAGPVFVVQDPNPDAAGRYDGSDRPDVTTYWINRAEVFGRMIYLGVSGTPEPGEVADAILKPEILEGTTT